MSSPSLAIAPPHPGQVRAPSSAGSCTTSWRGRCSGKLLALRLGTLALWRRRWLAGFGAGGVFGRAGFQFLEPEFEPLDLLADPLR
jgi:hypothetical protein